METIISNVYLYLDRINTIFDNLLHELLSLSSILREKKKEEKMKKKGSLSCVSWWPGEGCIQNTMWEIVYDYSWRPYLNSKCYKYKCFVLLLSYLQYYSLQASLESNKYNIKRLVMEFLFCALYVHISIYIYCCFLSLSIYMCVCVYIHIKQRPAQNEMAMYIAQTLICWRISLHLPQ